MACVDVDANWWVFDRRTDESGILAEAVGLGDLRLENLTAGKAGEILAEAAKSEMPHAE